MRKVRNIIHIDEELCTGCGQCVLDCAEGALQVIDGKARLVGEIYCDGLGACLSGCPTGALTVEQREAEDFDEQAVHALLKEREHQAAPAPSAGDVQPLACGCPGSAAMALKPLAPAGGHAGAAPAGPAASQLGHWPIKLTLLSSQAPFLQGADLLLLADCAAASLPDLHPRLLPGKAIALACPKLDDAAAHVNKLAQVLAGARPRSLTVVHMEVPCCKGLDFIAEKAIAQSGVDVRRGAIVVSRDGRVIHQDLPWAAPAAAAARA
ncbi:MAG: ATP-binding protein [Thermodesulfobacteriota bacterium]